MYSLTKNLLKTTHRNLKKIDMLNVEVVMDALKKSIKYIPAHKQKRIEWAQKHKR